MPLTQQQLAMLANRIGLVNMAAPTQSFDLAMDAQIAPVTVPNSGILALMSTYVDPRVIEILVSPLKAVQVVGEANEVKKGDWVTETAAFLTVESSGYVSAYGDYNEGGPSNANANFPQRQSFHYQTFTHWGERELEKMGLAKLDWANRLNVAAALTLNKFQNKSYLFGVSGLQNYGLTNDPALSAPIAPTTKAAGGTNWQPSTTPNEILADFVKLYNQLVTQSNGVIDRDSKLRCVLSPLRDVYLTATNMYNVNVADLLKKNFPNLEIVTVPEYSLASGELLQMWAPEIDGQPTAEVGFTEKMRAHPMIVQSSSFKQKKSQGTWGAIIYRPFLCAQMQGI